MATPSSQVRKVHFDTPDYRPQAITGLEPRKVPLLHQQQDRGSLEWENARYVSGWAPVRAVGWAEGPDPLLLPPGDQRETHPRSSGHQEKLGRAKALIFGISKTASKGSSRPS